MRVSFTTYKNSSAATALSILGTCSALIGLFSMMISVMMLIQSVDEDSVGTMIVGVLFFFCLDYG
ncbi:MAG: hypothetical protein LIO78_06300 [Clostridiales bacterium]|nr:hypothetical protein [Clostridiales bacterium]